MPYAWAKVKGFYPSLCLFNFKEGDGDEYIVSN